MLRSQLIERLARKLLHLSIQDIGHKAGLLIDSLSSTLCNKGRIEIRGFGSFCLHYCPPRKARNPKTGKRLVTQSKHRPHFKAGKQLREQVNAFISQNNSDKPSGD